MLGTLRSILDVVDSANMPAWLVVTDDALHLPSCPQGRGARYRTLDEVLDVPAHDCVLTASVDNEHISALLTHALALAATSTRIAALRLAALPEEPLLVARWVQAISVMAVKVDQLATEPDLARAVSISGELLNALSTRLRCHLRELRPQLLEHLGLPIASEPDALVVLDGAPGDLAEAFASAYVVAVQGSSRLLHLPSVALCSLDAAHGTPASCTAFEAQTAGALWEPGSPVHSTSAGALAAARAL